MTVDNVIEYIRSRNQDVGRNYILGLLDSAEKEFVKRTRILRKSSDLTIVDDTVEYSLPSNLLFLEKVLFYNSSGGLVTQELKYAINEFDRKILFKDWRDNEISEIPSTVSTITLYYVYRPDDLTVDGSFTVPAEYHTGLLARVMNQLAVMNGDEFKARALKGEWNEAILNAKKAANSTLDGSWAVNKKYYQ